MIAPLILGYVVGAVGFYAFISKTAMLVPEEAVAYGPTERGETEVIELYTNQEQRKAA